MDAVFTKVPKILIVDNDSTTHLIIDEALKPIAEFQCLACDNGEAALALLKDTMVDLVLLDIGLQGMNGLEVCRHIRQNPKIAHIPVVMMIGADAAEVLDQAYQLGATDFICKPINGVLSAQHIRFILFRRGTARRAPALDPVFNAFYDDLTGMANRAGFQEKLRQACERAEKEGRILAVVLLDLDRFQLINDTLGREMADQLIKAIGERISQLDLGSFFAAHLSSDEFSVLFTDLGASEDEARHKLQLLIFRLMGSLKKPLHIADQVINISVSMGYCLFPTADTDKNNVLKHANIALKAAKKEGGRQVKGFHPEQMVQRIRRFSIENGLKQAIKQHEFQMYYQPQFNADGRLIAAEALIRWPSASFGWISPELFVPVAEECGLIAEIGKWILETVCQQIKQWEERGVFTQNGLQQVAVNVSARQFYRANFLQELEKIIAKSAIQPQALELEMTESCLVQHVDHVLAIFDQLQQMGIQLALDDFGTGYSSLSYLRDFQPDKLKIDQSFVRNSLENEKDAKIVRAIIAMAKSLNITVLAEGVESRQHFDFLIQQGCQQFQGYYFGKAMLAQDFEQFIISQQATAQ